MDDAKTLILSLQRRCRLSPLHNRSFYCFLNLFFVWYCSNIAYYVGLHYLYVRLNARHVCCIGIRLVMRRQFLAQVLKPNRESLLAIKNSLRAGCMSVTLKCKYTPMSHIVRNNKGRPTPDSF